MDDDGWILIIPLGTFGVICFAIFIVGASIVYSVQQWFITNLQAIITVLGVISVISTIVTGIICKSFLSSLAHIGAFSQFIFYVVYGGISLPTEGYGFTVIWHLIIFVLYILYGIVNICAVVGINYFIIGEEFDTYNKSKNSKDLMVSTSLCNVIVCGVGWLLNAFIFLVL